MRTLLVFPFLVAVACGGPDLTTHAGLVDALIEARRDLAKALDGIEDKESAEVAKPALMKIAKRECEVYAALKKLGEPEGDKKKRLTAKLDAALKRIEPRIDKTLERLRSDPELRAVVDPMMEEYFATADPETARKQIVALRLQKGTYLRAIIQRLLASGKLPLKDGALDVFVLVRSGKVGPEEFYLFRERRGTPTDEEIRRGDYTNFPYERYRGSGDLDPVHPVPLLWDKKPDAHGMFVVGLSNGSVKYVDKDELAKLLGK